MVVQPAAIELPYITDLDLPYTDGEIVENFAEHPQALLLTSAIRPVLDGLHEGGPYLIGSNSGIYWKRTDPPLSGCKSPDWFYIPGVPQTRPQDHTFRRSYVLWNEEVPPYLVVELVSGDGSTERDDTENSGKFWVYENGIRAEYYAIFDAFRDGDLEVYERHRGRFRLAHPNERGRYELPEMGVELGVWHGEFEQADQSWLRFYDDRGSMLPSIKENVEITREAIRDAEESRRRAERADLRTEQANRRAEEERQNSAELVAKMAALEEKLRAMGIDPSK